jgi:hypothetical protein
MCCELKHKRAVLGPCCVGIVPLSNIRLCFCRSDCATYLEILCSAVPNVYSLEVRVIAVVKCASVDVELVGKDKLLLLAGG